MTITYKHFCMSFLLVVLLLPISGVCGEEDKPKQSTAIVEIRKADVQKVDPKKWGIQNNCIHTNRIRKISFFDNQSAIVQASRKKFILMTLKRPCYGVKHRIISYQSSSGRLCARFDYISVIDDMRDLGQGISCQIESFEPYILPLGDDGLPIEQQTEGHL